MLCCRQSILRPFSMRMIEIDAVGMYDTTAEEAGKVFVTTELSGGGTISARSATIAKRGIRNLLRHADILHGEVEFSPTTWLDMPSQECFGFADTEGLLEPLVDLGAEIRTGDLIARVHNVARTGVAPQSTAPHSTEFSRHGIFRVSSRWVIAFRSSPRSARSRPRLKSISTNQLKSRTENNRHP